MYLVIEYLFYSNYPSLVNSELTKDNEKRPNEGSMFDELLTTYDEDDDNDDYVEEEDYSDYENQSENDINFDFVHRAEKSKQSTDLDDFGIYICEASNVFDLENSFEKRASKRYIKVNANGAPILRIAAQKTASSSQLAADSVSTVMTPEAPADGKMAEAVSSLGESVALTCLIEPLPSIQTIAWVNDNGRILPNSKYSVFETLQRVDSESESKKKPKNFRVQYENLTVAGEKETLAGLVEQTRDGKYLFNHLDWINLCLIDY